MRVKFTMKAYPEDKGRVLMRFIDFRPIIGDLLYHLEDTYQVEKVIYDTNEDSVLADCIRIGKTDSDGKR